MSNSGRESDITCYKCGKENLLIYNEREKDTGGTALIVDCPNPYCNFEKAEMQRSDLEDMAQGPGFP